MLYVDVCPLAKHWLNNHVILPSETDRSRALEVPQNMVYSDKTCHEDSKYPFGFILT